MLDVDLKESLSIMHIFCEDVDDVLVIGKMEEIGNKCLLMEMDQEMCYLVSAFSLNVLGLLKEKRVDAYLVMVYFENVFEHSQWDAFVCWFVCLF